MQELRNSYYESNMIVNKELINLSKYHNVNLHEVDGLENILRTLFETKNPNLLMEVMQVISSNKETLFINSSNIYKYDCLPPKLFKNIKRRKKLLKSLIRDIKKNSEYGGLSLKERFRISYRKFLTYFS